MVTCSHCSWRTWHQAVTFVRSIVLNRLHSTQFISTSDVQLHRLSVLSCQSKYNNNWSLYVSILLYISMYRGILYVVTTILCIMPYTIPLNPVCVTVPSVSQTWVQPASVGRIWGSHQQPQFLKGVLFMCVRVAALFRPSETRSNGTVLQIAAVTTSFLANLFWHLTALCLSSIAEKVLKRHRFDSWYFQVSNSHNIAHVKWGLCFNWRCEIRIISNQTIWGQIYIYSVYLLKIFEDVNGWIYVV